MQESRAEEKWGLKMRKLLILGVLFVVVVGLLTFALVNLNSLIASNKDQILEQVENTIGRKVAIEEIGVTVWGGIGARLTQFRVADDSAFSSEDFVRAEGLQVNVALWPLLSQEVQVKRIILHKPQIQVIRNKEGVFNFASLTQTMAGEQKPTASAPSDSEDQSAPLPLLVALIDIDNGDVRYIDQQAGSDFRVTQLDLRAEDVSLDEHVSVELHAAVLSDQQNISVEVQTGPIGPNLDDVNTIPLEGKAAIQELDVATLQQALPDIARQIPAGLGISGPLNVETDFSGRVGAVNLSNVDVQASIFDSSQPNVKVVGSFGPVGPEIAEPLAESTVDADVSLGPLALEKLQQFGPLIGQFPPDLTATGPVMVTTRASGSPNNLSITSLVEAINSSLRFGDLFDKSSGQTLALSTQARLTQKAAALQELKLTFHTLEVTASGNVGLDDPPTLDLTIDSNQAELGEFHDLLPLLQEYDLTGNFETHMKIAGPLKAGQLPQINGNLTLDNGSATPAQLPNPVTDIQAAITFTGQGAEITNTTARIGQSELHVDAQVEQFQPLKATYEVRAPMLRMADLQPEASEDALQDIRGTGHVWLQGEDLRHTGKLTSTQGSVAQVAYNDLQLDSSVANQVAKIDRFRLQAFKGTIQGNGQYAYGTEQPQFSMTSQVKALNLTEFFRSALPLTDHIIRGIASFNVNVSGSGQTWEAIQPTLQGQGTADIVDGAVLDLNIAEGVLSGLTGISGLSLALSEKVRDKYPAIFTSPHTEFDELTSTFSLGNSRINLDSLRIAARDFMTHGKGWTDFNQQLDLNAFLALSKSLSADIVKDVKELKYITNDEDRLEVPFALLGVIPGVTPAPDASYVGTLIQRAATKALQDNVQEKILDKLLPSKKKNSEPGTASQEATQSEQTQATSEEQEQPASLEEQLLQKGLDSLFGR